MAITMMLGTPKTSSGSLRTSASLTGTMRVRAKDGRLLALSMEGPLTVSDTKPGHELEGKGEMKWGFETIYR